MIKRLIKWAVMAYVLMSLSMLAWTFLWPEPDVRAMEQADAIICLGGGMLPDGTLADSVLTRIETCVLLHEAGIAPVVIFSGGVARPQGPSAGQQMAHFARGLGLPSAAALEERAAQSTLHNALYSLDMIPNATKIVVVTEAFHLPRSWASFRWAAWERGRSVSVSLAMSEPVRRDTVTGTIQWRILARESLAIWFNLARGAAFSIAKDAPDSWLH